MSFSETVSSRKLMNHVAAIAFTHFTREGEGEAKGGTATGLARHLHLPSLHFHQRARDHQAKSSAAPDLRHGVVRAVEAGEEPGLLLCGQPDAAIGYRFPGNQSGYLDRKVYVSFLRSIFVRIG